MSKVVISPSLRLPRIIDDSLITDLPKFSKEANIGLLLSLSTSRDRIAVNEGSEPSERFSSVQFNSVAQSCPTLCDPMNCSTPGLPVHHQLPEFTQTHVHRVGDAIQPSHPLSSLLLPPIPPSIRVLSNESTLCCCSLAKSRLTLCNPLDSSTPGSSVLHYLPEYAQIHPAAEVISFPN